MQIEVAPGTRISAYVYCYRLSLQPDVVVTCRNTYMFRYGELIEHLKSQWF
jgi:hypothetical protein